MRLTREGRASRLRSCGSYGPIMDALLNTYRNLFRSIGASNFVLVDRGGVGFGDACDAECSNDVDLENASCFAGPRCVLRAGSGVTSNELASNVDVVALFETLRH